VRRLATA